MSQPGLPALLSSKMSFPSIVAALPVFGPQVTTLTTDEIADLVAQIHALIVATGGMPPSRKVQNAMVPLLQQLINLLFQLSRARPGVDFKHWASGTAFAEAMKVFGWVVTHLVALVEGNSNPLADCILASVFGFLRVASIGVATSPNIGAIVRCADRILRALKSNPACIKLIPKELHDAIRAVKDYVSQCPKVFGAGVELGALVQCNQCLTIIAALFPWSNDWERLNAQAIYDAMKARYAAAVVARAAK